MTSTKALYEKVRDALGRGESALWEAAEAMSELHERGESARAIARELGCSDRTVRRYLAVFSAAAGRSVRPSFTEAMAAVRDYSEDSHVPKTPERRAELAADLLKEKAVYNQPVVRKAIDRQVTQRIREDAAAYNREQNIPTRTQQTHEKRRTSVVINRSFWSDLLLALNHANRLLNDAAGELDRTGLPNDRAGDIIKAARTVGQAAERFGKSATARAVGSPMEPGRGGPRVKSS